MMHEDNSAKQVCKCFIVTNLGTIHRKVLPNFFLPKQIIKVVVFHYIAVGIVTIGITSSYSWSKTHEKWLCP